MAEHYTKSTVEARAFCTKCASYTMHRVDGGRKGPCLNCIQKLENAPKVAPAAKQDRLF